jgi:hypothetical protein
MSTRRYRKSRVNRNKSRKMRVSKNKTGKKWVTAIEAAQETLNKTGSIAAARQSLRKQALANARKLFGTI